MTEANIEQAPQPTAFELVGGEERVRALVDRFYDLMDLEPDFAALRALHPPTLENSRDKFFWFLCGWMGGPDHYISRFGHPRLRARHMNFAIASPPHVLLRYRRLDAKPPGLRRLGGASA